MYNLDIILLYISSAVTAVLSTYFIKGRILLFLKKKELVVENYAGNRVFTGGGLIILFSCIFGIIPYYIYGFTLDHIIYLAVVISMSLTGFMDDLAGDRNSKGIIGHTKTFIKGELTTGFVKAVIGCIMGAIVALTGYQSPFGFILNLIIFVLSVNIMNLLDLRPGRAIKGFLFFSSIFIAVSYFAELFFIISALAAILIYIKGELAEEYMLGDTGSNLIGSVLGLYAVRVLPEPIKVIYAVILIAFQIFAEFNSISKLIEAIPFLREIDRLGRRKSGENN